MIEAVNATVAASSLVRPMVEQEALASYAANPTQVQRIPQAPYISPYVSMNYTIDKAVLQFRDSESGEVVAQIPSDTQLRAYRRAAEQQPVIFERRAEVAAEKRPEVQQTAAPVEAPKVEEISTDSAPAADPIVVDTTA